MKFAVQRSLERPPKKARWKRSSRCYWCGQSIRYKAKRNPPNQATREHVQPQSLGGGGGRNIVAACRRCNTTRRTDGTWVPWHEQPEEWRHRGVPMQVGLT